MFRTDDVYALSDFQRNYSAHLERLKATRRPHLLTRNGKAALVVQDPDAYQELLDKVEEAETIIAIHRALQEAKRGEGVPLEELPHRCSLASAADIFRRAMNLQLSDRALGYDIERRFPEATPSLRTHILLQPGIHHMHTISSPERNRCFVL